MATTHHIGIIMNGVTGRMGTNQHLMRSIVAIMRQGGVKLSDREIIMPDPILVGRNAARLEHLATSAGIARWTTDLGKALSDAHNSVYFDAQVTNMRVPAIRAAIKAGKHIYTEKPTALTTDEAYELYLLAEEKAVKHGVVQDKLWLPGLIKLRLLRDSGFFGRILSVKGDFGYWVFDGEHIPAQRPSWNYRTEDGGGIIFDMLCHWRYVLDNVIAPVRGLSCLGATHIPTRWDEAAKPYSCTADDAAYATFELENGIVAQFASSWTTRVRRDDLLTIQVDGTLGSAVAGLRECWIQPAHATPRPTWNPDMDNPFNFFDQWMKVPSQQAFENAFKVQWELFLRHIVTGEPFPWGLLEGAKGVQLAEKGIESWNSRTWITLPDLKTIQKG
jgi:predicted dehydrogenase